MKAFLISLVLLLVVVPLVEVVHGLTCARQKGPGNFDLEENCQTFCIILFFVNKNIPSIATGGKPNCAGVGCAVLLPNGTWDENSIDKTKINTKGTVTVYKVTDAERTSKPDTIISSPNEPPNLYASVSNKCTGLELVSTFEIDNETKGSLETGELIAIIIGGATVVVIFCSLGYYCRIRNKGNGVRLTDVKNQYMKQLDQPQQQVYEVSMNQVFANQQQPQELKRTTPLPQNRFKFASPPSSASNKDSANSFAVVATTSPPPPPPLKYDSSIIVLQNSKEEDRKESNSTADVVF